MSATNSGKLIGIITENKYSEIKGKNADPNLPGTPKCEIRLAVQRDYPPGTTECDFIPVEFFGKMAIPIKEIPEGSLVVVEYVLKSSEFMSQGHVIPRMQQSGKGCQLLMGAAPQAESQEEAEF